MSSKPVNSGAPPKPRDHDRGWLAKGDLRLEQSSVQISLLKLWYICRALSHASPLPLRGLSSARMVNARAKLKSTSAVTAARRELKKVSITVTSLASCVPPSFSALCT